LSRTAGGVIADIDESVFSAKISTVTATHVIRQLKSLPLKERRKVFAYVDAEIERREERADRKAVAEARRDPRPAVPWEEAKKRLGMA
jgi:hypothetical protein